MPLKLYNTLNKREEEFVPLKKGKVTMYTCGPTVYGRPHIGNYSSFLMADLLRRWLEAGHGYKVTHVKNITDVGHLVADADTGEDKIEKQAREEFGSVTHDSVIGIARKYEAMYLEDEKALNLREPEHRPRATEYIIEMQKMVNLLLKSGHAYRTEDGIYFDVTSQTPTPYGTLSGNTLTNLAAGARVQVDEKKRHPADFALWKFCVGHNENHALRWQSPGKGNPEGFPGWHIECSCMSAKLLGKQFDIHTGGEDLIFPHHECEIAQSESASGKAPCVRHWVHKRFIDMGDQKMSKSLGNVLSLDDIRAMGYSPLDLRYYLLSVHYRTNLKFTEKGLDDAHKARRKIMEWKKEVDKMIEDMDEDEKEEFEGYEDSGGGYIQEFRDAMDADLNTPAALAVLHKAMTWYRSAPPVDGAPIREAFELFSIAEDTFGCFTEEADTIPRNILNLAEKRTAARASKNFEESDALRDQILRLGYEVKDTSEGQKLTKM